LADAKRVAVQLGIEFKVFDFEAEYRQRIVDSMIAEYKAGRTPNPDVMCNQEIKFKLFLETALKEGADLIATGHYARTKDGQLFAGTDTNKDQSYFLYRVTEEALQKTIFPVGDMTKPVIRQKATAFGLVTAQKKDSQGICFVGQIGIKEFLEQYIEVTPGQIIDCKTDTIVGEHDGAVFYTIGQRHGLGVGGGLPYYVVEKDMGRNIVYVTTDLNDDHLWRDNVRINQLHWINEAPEEGKEYQVRVRYRAKLIKARLVHENEDHMKVMLHDQERAVTVGQSLVVYDGQRVVGGGIVVR
jgi:tRNA-uridine 2-sulfurtransferase